MNNLNHSETSPTASVCDNLQLFGGAPEMGETDTRVIWDEDEALAGIEMARAQAGTIRLKLLKIGAVIVRNTRRVRFQLSSACPDKALFTLVAARLDPG